MSDILTDLKTFVDTSFTSWHAVKEIGNRLALRDFQPLMEGDKWTLEAGKRYFFTRGGSLCAFCIPKNKPLRATLLASHTDSPALKLKSCPTYQTENFLQLNTEVYGGPLLSSWLNRDLTLAGRVMITNERGEIEEKLVHIDDAFAFIPQLAIHLDKEVNEKGLILNKHEHLSPILGLCDKEGCPKESFERLLKRHLAFRSLLSFELFLVPADPARFVGLQGEMFAAYRIDNLVSAHAALCAMGSLEAPAENHLQMAVFLDHEEIGSATKEGADSVFLRDLFCRIGHSLQLNAEESVLLRHHSFCASIDVAHALNPNYPNKQDPRQLPLMGKGIALKSNANQKYASSAPSYATLVAACQALNLPYQHYVSRSDISCGSTVGPLVAKQTGITTADLGCAQLSMHAAREVIATNDYLDLVKLLTYLLKKG